MSRNRNFSKLVNSFINNTDINSGVMVRKNEQLLSANLVIDTNKNAMMVGPIELANNVSLIINGHLSIV